MRRSRLTLLDFTFNAIGVLFTLWFMTIAYHKAGQRSWPLGCCWSYQSPSL